MPHRFLILLAMLVASCGSLYPLAPGDRDVLELERVWQYMRVYSLYADRVPSHANAFEYSDPYSLVMSLGDTLHDHWHDTVYEIGSYYYNMPVYKRSAAVGAMAAGNATVYAWTLTDSVAYVGITEFDSTTVAELRAVYPEISSRKAVIIDLLDNGGGSLDACTSAVDLFVPADREYLQTTFRQSIFDHGDTGTVVREPWRTRHTGDLWEGKQVVVLMNKYTASAAEILTVGLADGLGDSCLLVGQQSFGKAIGQYRFDLYSGSGLVLTGFRFYRVKGPDYQERGIDPDLPVAPPYFSTLADFRNLVKTAGEKLQPGFSQVVNDTRIDVIGRTLHNAGRFFKSPAGQYACYSTITPPRDLPLGSN